MSFQQPWFLAIAVVAAAAAVAYYLLLHRRRAAALRQANLTTPPKSHLPYALMLVALPIMVAGLARPQAEVTVPRVSGTVILAFDVSNSMGATDVSPTRLGAAQSAAAEFVADQPETVDVGVLPFGDQALLTQAPTPDREAVSAAITRLRPGGGTSLGQAILVALGAITGSPVTLDGTDDLGYWPSATIVVFSDGQNTGGPDATAASEKAAAAGVRIQTVGVGTARGATVEVDGYQLGTALDEALLTTVARTSGGAYHPAGDAGTLSATTRAIDLRLTTEKEPLELTGLAAAAGLALLAAGALLATRRHGRIV
jgi:Ca-activated chloride channel homolog